MMGQACSVPKIVKSFSGSGHYIHPSEEYQFLQPGYNEGRMHTSNTQK